MAKQDNPPISPQGRKKGLDDVQVISPNRLPTTSLIGFSVLTKNRQANQRRSDANQTIDPNILEPDRFNV